MSDADKVKEFTEGAGNKECPRTPQQMSRESVLFIIRMIFSELDELACTVTKDESERDVLLQEAFNSRDKCQKFTYTSDEHLIGAQFDALVDSWYYSLNTAANHGVNMSRIFNLVHQANMAKRDPVTKKFLRRPSDGKILKPEGWKEPDITQEICRQKTEGAWTPDV